MADPAPSSSSVRTPAGTAAASPTASPSSPSSSADRSASSRQGLLSPEFMHRLDQLDVLSRKVLQGKLQGERRSKKRGQSVEFADYRAYAPGDDLRFIDWNLYARLDRLFLRLFMEEEDLTVAIALDVSKSMDWGDPNKLHYARQLAAALGYIALSHYNRVSLYTLAHTVIDQQQNMRGRRPIPKMLDFLATRQPAGEGNLQAAVRRLALLERGKGVVILISDFLDRSDLDQALKMLPPDRHDVYVIQVLAPQEIDPTRGDIVGDLQLTDIEDQDTREITVSPALIKRYKATLHAWCEHVRGLCAKRDMVYLMTDTAIPFDSVVLRYLRERGLVG